MINEVPNTDATNQHPPLQGIKHMVVFNLVYEKGSEEARTFLGDAKRLLSVIPGVRNFQAYQQISPKNNYTYGLSMLFTDAATYDAYSNHPVHVEFVEKRWLSEVTEFMEIDFVDFDSQGV